MTMNGEPVQPEGLDLMRDLEQWLLEHPNDYQVQQRLHDLGRDPRFADADEPDDIMPEVPDLADFPLPSGLDKYVSAVRFISGASIPTSAACVAAAFNLLAAEDVDVKSLASDPHPVSLYFIVGSESGWRKSSSFRQAMQGHLESDERVEEQFRDISSNKQESTLSEDMFSQPRGFSPRALRQDFTIEALLTRLWKARRTMCVANSDASSLLGGWSFRSDNNSRTLSHFVNLWDGDPTSIDRRNPEAPEMFFYQRRLTGLIMGQVNVIEDLLFSQAAGNGFTARCLASVDRERPKPPDDGSGEQSAECVAVMRKLVIGRREDQDALVEALRGASRRPVLYPEPEARDLLAAASAKFDLLSDNADNPHERGFWARPRNRRPATLPRWPTCACWTGACPSPGRTCGIPGPRWTPPRRS